MEFAMRLTIMIDAEFYVISVQSYEKNYEL